MISADVLARYAGDAAREVDGVAGLAESGLQRGKSVAVSGDEDTLAIELSLELAWGRSAAGGRERGAAARLGVPRADGERHARVGRRRLRRGRAPRRRSDDLASRRPHGRDARERTGRVPDMRLVAEPREPRAGEAEVDRARGDGVGRVGDDLPRRRRPRARLDAVRAVGALSACRRPACRAAVGRRRSRDVRVPALRLAAVGRAVALPRGDRRGARQGREGARGVRVPLPRGHAAGRALPRPPHGLPARLPRRLRLPDGALGRPDRARAARARRADPVEEGTREKVLRRVQEVLQPSPAPAPPGP